MKRIYIITRHAIANYGSLLQSMATVNYFKSLGYESFIIDYISKNENVLNNLNNYAVNRNLHGIKKIAYILLKLPEEYKKNYKFLKMRKKYLLMTNNYSSADEMKNKFDNSILCSGGDQLWGYMPNMKLDEAYYLSFSNKTNNLISFSSSFGRYDFDKYNCKIIKEKLSRYDAITVREKSAVEFLNQIGVKSNCVLDPTLLVDKNMYETISEIRYIKKDYILVYKLRQDQKLNELAKKIADKYKLKIVFVSNTIFNNNKEGKTFINPQLSKLISLFKYSSFVITDSFHATVLSVIFEKEFYTHLPGKTNARIIDFVDSLELNDRVFYDSCDFEKNKNINYSNVNSKLKVMRDKSNDIILNILKKIND